MERERNNTGLIVAVTIIAMLVVGLVGFIIYDKVINKPSEPGIEDNGNNGEQTPKDDDVYGYIAIEDRIVELHSDSKNKTIASASDTIILHRIEQNKLYYSFSKEYSFTIMSIDLNDASYSSVEVVDSNLYDMDWTEKYNLVKTKDYIFTEKDGNIWRYDLVTNEKKSIFEVYQDDDIDYKYIDNIFVVDSTLYVGSNDYCDINCTYFTIDFDGNNYQKMTANQFNRIKSNVEIVYPLESSPLSYVLYKDKEITIKEQDDISDILMVDYKSVYQPKNNRRLRLLYDLKEETGTIVFEEYEYGGFEEYNQKYYRYNLNTKKLSEISENETYWHFSDILYVK